LDFKRSILERRTVMDSNRIGALALAVVVVSAIAIVIGTQRAAAADRGYFDDFSDTYGYAWRSSAGVILDATSGDLVVTSAPTTSSAWPLWGRPFDADVSIRTRVRLLEDQHPGGLEGGVGLFARLSDGMSYAARIMPNGEIAITLSQEPFDDVVLASMVTGLDVLSSDIHLQFDVFGDTLALTAWAEGKPRPVMPQLWVTDTSQPGVGTLGLFGQRAADSRAVFRFFRSGPRRPVNLSDTTSRKIGIHVVANDCATAAVKRVAPELTDPNIDNFGGGGGDHRVYYNAHVLERDELHVFLPGTGTKPEYAREFMQEAAGRGMKTIGLQYVNGPNHDMGLCLDFWAAYPYFPYPDCMEDVLAERTYGGDLSLLVSVNQPNSLVSRLVKLLEYLDAEQPERGWGHYLDGGAPDWDRIVFSGHSQGAAISALLGRDHELTRAIMLDGPYETTKNYGAPAAFLTDPKATPIERYFGFGHVDYNPWLRPWLWDAMGLPGPPVLVENSSPPYEGSHYLETDVDVPTWATHGSMVNRAPRAPDGTPIFKDVWRYLLGVESGQPCGGEAVYASDPLAALLEIPGGATLRFDRANNKAAITIPGGAWAPVVAEGFGGCSVAGSDGLICDSVSDYTIAIDLNDNLAVPTQGYWTGQLIAGGSTLNLTAREPDVAADGFFYQEVAGQTIAVACSTAASIPAGECLPTDLRPPEAYDPITGTFTYLGVVDGFADPAYGLSRFAIEEVPVLPTEIDIKPGSDPNPVNPYSRGVIPVAILGSDTFDVAEVDVTTLAFGPDGAAPAHPAGGHIQDVNDDGFTDLLSHYRTQQTGIVMGDTDACLTGETLDGTPFKGCDAISATVPCGGGYWVAFVLPAVVWVGRKGVPFGAGDPRTA
jgi:hypothetical protein